MALSTPIGGISRTLGATHGSAFASPQSPAPLIDRHPAEGVHRTINMPLARQPDAASTPQSIPDGVDAIGTVMRSSEGSSARTDTGGSGEEGGNESGGGGKVDFEKMKDEMLATLRTELRVERERARGWI